MCNELQLRFFCSFFKSMNHSATLTQLSFCDFFFFSASGWRHLYAVRSVEWWPEPAYLSGGSSDRKKPSLCPRWRPDPQRRANRADWTLLLLGTFILWQDCSAASRNKRPKAFLCLFYTGELSRLVEWFHFWLLCSPGSDSLWSVTLFLLHVPFWCHSKESLCISFVYF